MFKRSCELFNSCVATNAEPLPATMDLFSITPAFKDNSDDDLYTHTHHLTKTILKQSIVTASSAWHGNGIIDLDRLGE